ncbi:hypothetical protein CRENBAI_021111 [Crenichthys baileyi]|uniref:Uncharacterized protein n=1 Tax=Crenichthys baileyi TaxID=28760 RepID=A0AAV9RWR9_9TELE
MRRRVRRGETEAETKAEGKKGSLVRQHLLPPWELLPPGSIAARVTALSISPTELFNVSLLMVMEHVEKAARCDGQVLLHRCSSSVSNQLGFFREWRARGRRQLVVVHSVILLCRVFHGFFCTSSLESFLKECESSKSRRLRLMVPALFSNSKPSLSKNSPSPTQSSIHLPVHPPTSPSSHSGASPQKKGHQLEITGTNLLTACRPQTLWRRTYSPPSSSNHQLN